jgi:hypothetical protein
MFPAISDQLNARPSTHIGLKQGHFVALESHRVVAEYTTIDESDPVSSVGFDFLLVRSALGTAFLSRKEGGSIARVGGDTIDSNGLRVEDPLELGAVEDAGGHGCVFRLRILAGIS